VREHGPGDLPDELRRRGRHVRRAGARLWRRRVRNRAPERHGAHRLGRLIASRGLPKGPRSSVGGDMDMLEFTRVPQTREAIATILAALILADLQSGQARSLPDAVAYGPGADVIASPDETIARGSGNSADLVRLLGATQGDQVGCIGDPVTGFHCFLLTGTKV